MRNIFLVSPRLGPDDRFTAAWHDLLDSYPDLDQLVVDALLRAAGHAPATLRDVEDYPVGTAEDRPDFLLRCDTLDIICEHKLDSPLDHRQLERYLALPRSKAFVVALINMTCVISREALAAPHYLRPRHGHIPHVLWKDLYDVIASHPSRLASDFAAYMRTQDAAMDSILERPVYRPGHC